MVASLITRIVNTELDLRFLLWYCICTFPVLLHLWQSDFKLPVLTFWRKGWVRKISLVTIRLPNVRFRRLQMVSIYVTNWGVLGLRKDNLTFSISKFSAGRRAVKKSGLLGCDSAHWAVGLRRFEGAQCLHFQGPIWILRWPLCELEIWMMCGANSWLCNNCLHLVIGAAFHVASDYKHIYSVPGGMCQTSGGCSLC